MQTGTVLQKMAPSIIDGKDARIDVTANESAVFRSNAALVDFVRVELDGKELTRDTDYTVKEGSTIISLTMQFLKTLTPGTHTIGIVSSTGTAETDFTVISKTTPAPTPSPNPTATPAATATPTPDTPAVPTPTQQPATTPSSLPSTSTKEPTGTTGSSSPEKLMEAVVTTQVPTAAPQPKTPALVVTSDADASQTTSETPDQTVELQPTELPESMANDPKEPGQTEEK